MSSFPYLDFLLLGYNDLINFKTYFEKFFKIFVEFLDTNRWSLINDHYDYLKNLEKLFEKSLEA